MASWVLTYKKCDEVFSYSHVGEETLFDYFLPLRPDFTPEGTECECPNCKVKSTYQSTELRYQSEPQKRGYSA